MTFPLKQSTPRAKKERIVRERPSGLLPKGDVCGAGSLPEVVSVPRSWAAEPGIWKRCLNREVKAGRVQAALSQCRSVHAGPSRQKWHFRSAWTKPRWLCSLLSPISCFGFSKTDLYSLWLSHHRLLALKSMSLSHDPCLILGHRPLRDGPRALVKLHCALGTDLKCYIYFLGLP